MSSINPEHNLTPAEIETRNRLEAIAQHHLGTYLLVDNAFAEIRDRHLYRDSHPSFEAYVRERWGVNIPDRVARSQDTVDADTQPATTSEREPRVAPRQTPCGALARACEETLAALGGEDPASVEIRLAMRKSMEPGAPPAGQRQQSWNLTEPIVPELVPTLRWLLTQASGTIGDVANQLESRAADIDDHAREQLRDDVVVLEGELAVVKALLLEEVDWDSELTRLLKDELPPFDTDADPEDDA